MLTRIVRMAFRPEETENFRMIFNRSKYLIRNMPGCHHLELHTDYQDDSIFFTISIWETETDLENYRKSSVFKETWKDTKALFREKPIAYSLRNQEILDSNK